MAPQVLHNVVHGSSKPEPWQEAMLSFQPAILYGYRRHRVRGAEYPAIVSVIETEDKNSASIPSSTARTSVLGTLVSGLTDGDIHRLDIFEGGEYERKSVTVQKLHTYSQRASGESVAEGQLSDALDAASEASEGEEVSAVTYVWISGEDELEDAEWDFESFKRDKLIWWAGPEARGGLSGEGDSFVWCFLGLACSVHSITRIELQPQCPQQSVKY